MKIAPANQNYKLNLMPKFCTLAKLLQNVYAINQFIQFIYVSSPKFLSSERAGIYLDS
jgi:hypothetical protein